MMQILACAGLFSVLPVSANPEIVSALSEAAGKAASDCVGDAVEGTEAAPFTDGVSIPGAFLACNADFAARSAAAVVGWAASAAVIWWDSTVTTTTLPCGTGFELQVDWSGHQETCYNFPAGSQCYRDCCTAQQAYCNGQDDVDECMKERACITPNIEEFSAEQLFFLTDDMGRLNAAYNAMIAALQNIDIAGMSERREWLDLALACQEMIAQANDFIHIVHRMKDNIYCRSPGTLCQIASASHAFELTSATDTCFKFLGPCYNTCCDVQRQYCGDDQCLKDRGCREHTPAFSLQRDLCNDLTDCRSHMEDAVTYINDLRTCSTVLAAAAPGTSPCTKSILQSHYDHIEHFLTQTHDALVRLESTAAGAPGTHLVAAPEEFIALPPPQATNTLVLAEADDLSHYASVASDQPFTVQRYHPSTGVPGGTTATVSGWSSTVIIGVSSTWTLLILLAIYGLTLTLAAKHKKQERKETSGGNVANGEATSPSNDLVTPLWEGGDEESCGDHGVNQTNRSKSWSKPTAWSFERKITMVVVVWGLGQVALWYISSPQRPQPAHQDPQLSALSGHVTLQDSSKAYWDVLSSDMSLISEEIRSLGQSPSCPSFLIAPLSSNIGSLFSSLTTMPQ